ncbi:MAG: LuxR C-terminal-related transcriptional regulator [Hyphomicrobiaceae bacterium]
MPKGEQNYTQHDPVYRTALIRRRPFSWSGLMKTANLSKLQQRVMNEAMEAGLKDGVALGELLTVREREILKWCAHNKSANDIADILNISSRTVECHLTNIYTKLGVNGRILAVLTLMESNGSSRCAGLIAPGRSTNSDPERGCRHNDPLQEWREARPN